MPRFHATEKDKYYMEENEVEFLEDESTVVDPSTVIADVAKRDFDQIAVIGLKDGEFFIWSSHPEEEMENMIDDAFDVYFGDEDEDDGEE